VVPPRAASGETTEEERPVAVVPARRFEGAGARRVFYQTLTGDTLERVGRAFGVAVADLAAWNALDADASLHSGMMLQIHVPAAADLSRARYLDEEDVRVITAGSDEFYEYFEGLQGRQRIVVEAEEGDTLTALGRRYGMSSGMMERINRFSRRKKLSAGDRVIVYSKRPGSGSLAEGGPAPLVEMAAPRPDLLPGSPAALGAPNGARSVD
jgi:murein DD-endopeptidase MepM/ murein hydrolase activator NlpD